MFGPWEDRPTEGISRMHASSPLRRPLPGLTPVLDGLRRGALGTREVIDDLSAILRASHAARRLLETPDAALAARGLDRAGVVPHAFQDYFAHGAARPRR